jgi:hypothetical protein
MIEAAGERVWENIPKAARSPAENSGEKNHYRRIWSRTVTLPLPAAAAAAVFVIAISLVLSGIGRGNASSMNAIASIPGYSAERASLQRSGAGEGSPPVYSAEAEGRGFTPDHLQVVADNQGIVPIQDMAGVLQYLSGQDYGDFMVIRLPESRSFSRIGEPALINAADYSRRTARR